MRQQTRSKSKWAALGTAFLPGFEPEGVVPDQHYTLASNSTTTPVAAYIRATDVAQATAQVADQLVPAQVMPAEPLAELLLDSDEEFMAFDVGSEVEAQPRDWPTFNLANLVPPSGETERIEQNLKVLRLARELKASGTNPTAEQREEILRYSGWGSIARIFEDGHEGKKLEGLRGELKDLLTEEEWKSARASTPNAHYTDPEMVRVLWQMLRTMGFEGGNVLEPAAGTGLFLAGMPADVAAKSQITAVELDTVSGGLLSQVFTPLGVKVSVTGLEKSKLPNGFFDLVVGNIPFGNYRVPDTSRATYANWSIHNWFMGRSLDLVRPGGLVVFITSSYTMEGTPAVREWLEVHAELLDAVRLPQGAFSRQAKTDVVTDVLVLRKRHQPKFGSKAAWVQPRVQAPEAMLIPGQTLGETVWHRHGSSKVEFDRKINPFYIKHPTKVLGKLRVVRDRFGKHGAVPELEGSMDMLMQRLHGVLTHEKAGQYEPAKKQAARRDTTLVKHAAVTETKPGQYVLHQGKLCLSEGETWVDVDGLYPRKTRDRIIGMMSLRDAAKEVLAYQSEHTDDVGLAPLQRVLNERYDAFVAKHGCLFDKQNVRAFRADPDCPLVLSLERYDEETRSASKADIFTKRTVRRATTPKHVDNVKDALLISLGLYGEIDLPDMARRMRRKVHTVVEMLRAEGLAYKDPVSKKWVEADEYLSGHIRNKLAIARAAGEEAAENVAALEQVLPKPLGPGEIAVRLGAPWVPASVIEQFMVETMELSKDRDGEYPVKVTFVSEGALWSVVPQYHRGLSCTGSKALREERWGTPVRGFFELLEAGLNMCPPTVNYTDADGRTRIDQPRTLQAREKYEAIREHFKAWVFSDPERTEMLVQIYNDLFNQIVPRKYDGSHLTLPGLSDVYTPYPHQKNAIWRALVSGNVLLAHVVGAGKSLSMISICMEMRRLGKANKPCIVVPAHLVAQMAAEVVRAYPNANVLMASKEMFQGDKRREFAARVATGDWDVVVMSQPTFERLPMRPEKMNEYVQQMLGKVRLALESADSGAKRTVKELEKRLKTLEAKLAKETAESKKDDLVYFDQLGIDYLAIDEAHWAKSLIRISKMQRIAGLPNTSSQRAFDLLVKTRAVDAALGGGERGLTMASATPLSNSVSEMHTFQTFLQPQTLEELGIDSFDAWAATFAEMVTGLEIAPDGSGYRMNTRMSSFCNVPELMAIFRMRADIQTAAMLKLPVPNVAGGKTQVVVCEGSDALKAFTKELVERASKLRGSSVDPRKDNMLKITHEGRIAALDMRMIDPRHVPSPNEKMGRICSNILRIRRETQEERGTQLVFCDISTPKAVGFSFYNQLRADLMAHGVPADEIAFIHDFDTDVAKEKLFQKVRDGVVRVLLGSTGKLGTGTNVQLRLKALHHADVPWRACDIEQRDGRVVRPGNMWSEVEIYSYLTSGSFDAYMAQLVETKAKFVEQVMSGETTIRTIEDISMRSLSYAEMKALASGNPMVLRKATIDAEVIRLSTLRNVWENDRWNRTSNLRADKQRLQHLQHIEALVQKDQAAAVQAEAEGWIFNPARGEVAEAVQKGETLEARIGWGVRRASALVGTLGDLRVGNVGGFEINVIKCVGRKVVEIVRPHSGISVRVDVLVSQPEQTGCEVMEYLRDMVNLEARYRAEMRGLLADIAQGEAATAAEFEHAERLAALCIEQAQINAELDLNKDEAGAAMAEGGGDEAVEGDNESTEMEEVAEA